jgi:hypothetical protein
MAHPRSNIMKDMNWLKLEISRHVKMIKLVSSKLFCIGQHQLKHQVKVKNQISASYISCWDPWILDPHGLRFHCIFQSFTSSKISSRKDKEAFIAQTANK